MKIKTLENILDIAIACIRSGHIARNRAGCVNEAERLAGLPALANSQGMTGVGFRYLKKKSESV